MGELATNNVVRVVLGKGSETPVLISGSEPLNHLVLLRLRERRWRDSLKTRKKRDVGRIVLRMF